MAGTHLLATLGATCICAAPDRSAANPGARRPPATLDQRLRDPNPKKGPLAYYRNRCRREQIKWRVSYWTFAICSLSAILATGLKLLTLAGLVQLAPESAALLTSVLGVLVGRTFGPVA